MKVDWITHSGKRILKVDYRGMNEQEMLKQLEYGTDVILKEKDKILYLGIFTDTIIFPAFMEKANSYGKDTDKKLIKGAIVGVSGMKSMLLNTYNMLTGSKMKALSSENEALSYLTKD
jgi:hypothetical protein